MGLSELHRVEVGGMTRSSFLVRGALATGAAFGASAVGPYVARSLAAVAANDLQILGFALQLEQVEIAFYKAAVARAGLSGKARALATEFGSHETEHADAIDKLITQLGAKPAAAPKTKFGLTDQASFLRLAVQLEDTGVSAFDGAAPAVSSPDILLALGGIVQTEARHSAALRTLAGQDPAPNAFEKALPAEAVQSRVQPFLSS
jgi:Ferritin-like domain